MRTLQTIKLDNAKLFNPCNVRLTELESDILGLGFKFRCNLNITAADLKQSLISSLHNFKRRLTLALHFAFHLNDHMDIPKLTNNTYLPPEDILMKQSWYKHLQDYITKQERTIEELKLLPIQRGIDRVVLDCARHLGSRKDIVVKPADKNLGVVILPTDYYNNLCMEHLADTTTYQVINDTNFKLQAYQNLKLILERHDKLYAIGSTSNSTNPKLSKLARSLLQYESNPIEKCLGRFYCLPKMHKTPIKGRPIIASRESLTYVTSQYLHNRLHPLTKPLSQKLDTTSICHSVHTFIEDLKKLYHRKTLPSNTRIITADVTSLYPSIPIDYGLSTLRHMLHRTNSFDPEEVEFLMDLLEWVLTNNYFEFNGIVYRQLKGTAMGTPVAVSYAQLVLLEHDWLLCKRTHLLFYRRYIDDLFIITDDPEVTADIIATIFNSVCATIKLEALTNATSGTFLDVSIILEPTYRPTEGLRLMHTLYEKPINNHLYIPATSAHPRHTLRNFIVNEARRIRSHCQSMEAAKPLVQRFASRLQLRGYKREFIDNTLRRYNIRQHPPRSGLDPPVLTISLPKLTILPKWRQLFSLPDILRDHPNYKQVYGGKDLVVGRRMGPHIGSFLLHAKAHQQPLKMMVTPLEDDIQRDTPSSEGNR